MSIRMTGLIRTLPMAAIYKVSPADVLRLRWNPFYAYLEKRVLDFLDLERTLVEGNAL